MRFFNFTCLLSLSGVSACRLITECIFSSPSQCRLCGEPHSVNHDLRGSDVFVSNPIFSLWHHRSALQSLHKACEVARCHNYFPGSLFLTWVSYYQSRVSSDQVLVNEWNAMQDVQSHRADSPVLFSDVYVSQSYKWVLFLFLFSSFLYSGLFIVCIRRFLHVLV